MEDSANVLSPQQTAATQPKGRGKRSCKTKGSVQEAADKIRAKARVNRKTGADGQAEHRLHSTLAKQIEKTSKDQVNSLRLSPPNCTSQSLFSQVESDMDNLGQVATNIQDSGMPGCSYWSNPILMAHSLPGPVQTQHTKTEDQLMPLVVQQWFTQLIGQGMMGGFQMTNAMQADSRVDSLHCRKHSHPPGLTLRTRTCSPATSEDEHSDCLVEEGEIDSLSEEEIEPEVSDTKGLFKPHLFKALLAKAKGATGLEFNKETPCATHKIVALVRTPTLVMQPSLDVKSFVPFPVESSSAVGLFPNFNTCNMLGAIKKDAFSHPCPYYYGYEQRAPKKGEK
ncbi:hypothetical protein E2320_022310 [Naja naja]|nr:hypothetical protein E2320_022310 [Naja naja]